MQYLKLHKVSVVNSENLSIHSSNCLGVFFNELLGRDIN